MTGYSPTLSTDTIREDGTRSWWRAFSGHQTQKGFFKFPYQITINQTSSLGNSQRQVVFPLSRPTMQNGRQNTVGEHSDETEPADRQPTRRGRWSGSWRCHVRCKYSPGEHSTAAFPASALWRTDMFPRLRWYALYVMWKQRTYGTCCLAADELVTSGSASTFWTPLKQPGRQTARERRSLKNCSALTTPAAWSAQYRRRELILVASWHRGWLS